METCQKGEVPHLVSYGANIATWPDGNMKIIFKRLKQAQGQRNEIWKVSIGDPRVTLLLPHDRFQPPQ